MSSTDLTVIWLLLIAIGSAISSYIIVRCFFALLIRHIHRAGKRYALELAGPPVYPAVGDVNATAAK